MVDVVLPDERRARGGGRAAPAALAAASTSTPRRCGARPITVFVRRDWMDALGGTTPTGALLGNIVWILIVLVAA